VAAVNDPPTLKDLHLSGTEDTAFVFNADLLTAASATPAIQYVGLQADLGAGWRDASTPKTYDIDSNNSLGSDGWWLTGSSPSLPNYITSFSNNSYYYTNGGYAQIDNPATTPGANPSTIYTGTTNQQWPGYLNLSASPVISFTLAGPVPNAIRLGIMTGNTDDAGNYGSSGFEVVSGTLDSGITSELQTNNATYNGNPDWVFFDITGGIAGQVYSVYARGGPRGNAGIAGLSFDSAATKAYADVEDSPLASITIVSLPATGTLTVSGVDAYAGQVVAAASISNLVYSPGLNQTGAKAFSVSASDGSASSSVATISIDFAAVNDPPIATAGGTLVYTENDLAAAIDTTLTLADVDNTSLTGANVTIAAGLTSGDLLGFTSQNGIAGAYDSGTGVLSLTGIATLSQYQAALRSISYSSSSENPTATAASRTISWQVNDGSAVSIPVTSTVSITSVNDAPTLTAAGQSAQLIEGDAASAVVSGSLLFDGINDVLVIPDHNSLDLSGNFTLEAWIYPTGNGGSAGAAGGIIFNKEFSYELARFADGSLQYAFSPDGQGASWVGWTNSGLQVPTDTWSHVAMVKAGGTVTIVVNRGPRPVAVRTRPRASPHRWSPINSNSGSAVVPYSANTSRAKLMM
jgi:hypothetical protein